MRGRVHQIDIEFAVKAAEGGIGQVQGGRVLDFGLGIELPQGEFDGFGRPQMARADGGGKDEDSFGHGLCVRLSS